MRYFRKVPVIILCFGPIDQEENQMVRNLYYLQLAAGHSDAAHYHHDNITYEISF